MAHTTITNVKETSTTTGSGSYTLAGAVAGNFAFDDILNIGDTTVCEVTMGNDFEYGIYTYSGTNTLTRTTIFNSSTTGGAVAWGAGTKNITMAPLGEFAGLSNQLHNLIATTDPTSSKDITQSYMRGSHWFNTNALTWWIARSTAAAAAVWDRLLTSTGLFVKEGSNCKQGTAVLVAGTVTVANTSVTANSRIFLTAQSLGTVAAPKALAVTGRNAGTDFTIASADATDTSVVAYEIFEPA